jgi:hypothetical protein
LPEQKGEGAKAFSLFAKYNAERTNILEGDFENAPVDPPFGVAVRHASCSECSGPRQNQWPQGGASVLQSHLPRRRRRKLLTQPLTREGAKALSLFVKYNAERTNIPEGHSKMFHLILFLVLLFGTPHVPNAPAHGKPPVSIPACGPEQGGGGGC